MKLYEFFNVPVDKKEKQFPDFGKPKTQEEKAKLADELFWYIVDHDDLHKEFVMPFAREIKGQITASNFNRDRWTKYWMPMVNKGCKLFYKRQKLKDNPDKLFDDELKDELCKRLGEKFIDDVKDDQYYVGAHKK